MPQAALLLDTTHVATAARDSLAHHGWQGALSFPAWTALVFLFGVSVGAAEIVSRYRDDPWRPFQRRTPVWSAWAYLLLNGVVGAALFVFLDYTDSFPELKRHWLALLSGFSGMALLRSKLFTIRTPSDEDIAVGADAVVSAFLQALDRDIDREQSSARWALSWDWLHDVKEDQQLRDLAEFCRRHLDAYQNVTNKEVLDFEVQTKKLLETQGTPNYLKAVAVGLALQTIAGSVNFEDLAKEFRQVAGLPPKPAQP